jgi:hypothetical protein
MKSLLFFLVAFIAVSAFVSGLLMLAKPDGSILNLPVSILEPTPFNNFLVPGIILTVAVGGINLLAVFFNLQRHVNRYNWALAGGIMITGWIITQMILTETAHWLHFVYFGIGILIILVSWQLKGKWAV